MGRDGSDPQADGAVLSRALKSVRRLRGWTPAETASAMNLPLRTYERFEAGETRLNLDYVHRFAAALDCDPQAILLAVATASPEVARRCADNKLALIFTIAFRQFDERLGDGIARLTPGDIIAAMTEMFDRLADRPNPALTDPPWLADGRADLAARRPRPGR